MKKMDEILEVLKVNELLGKKQEAKKEQNIVLWIFAIIGGVAAVAAIVYAVYRYFTPSYLEDFEEDFEDDFEDDFFEEEDDEKETQEASE